MSNNFIEKDQLTGVIYEEMLSSMKKVLDLGQFKIGSSNSKEFAYFKSEVMNSYYNGLRNVFEEMKSNGLIEDCDMCNNDLRKGWKNCQCRGCGYMSKKD